MDLPTLADLRPAADPFQIYCSGFRTRFCPNPLPSGAAYCGACQARADDFHAWVELIPIVGTLAAHVREAVVCTPCLSCGDRTLAPDYCAACIETGEHLRLAPVVRRVMKAAA